MTRAHIKRMELGGMTTVTYPEKGYGELLTVEDAAKVLKIGRSNAYLLVRRGELRSVHIGRSVRIPAREIDRFVAELMADEPAHS